MSKAEPSACILCLQTALGCLLARWGKAKWHFPLSSRQGYGGLDKRRTLRSWGSAEGLSRQKQPHIHRSTNPSCSSRWLLAASFGSAHRSR